MTIFFYLNNCLKLMKKYEKRQRNKLIVAFFIKRNSITSITFIINDTSITSIVNKKSTKRERERFRKISIKT